MMAKKDGAGDEKKPELLNEPFRNNACCGSNEDCCGGCGGEGECNDGPGESPTRVFVVLTVLAAVFLAVWSFAKVVEIKRMLAYPPAGMTEHTITLSETGKAQVAPDTSEIELSVLSEGKTPQDAQRDNTQKMNAIIDFVKSSKVDTKDVKTATYSLYPKYEYSNGRSDIIGYTLTQSLRVKLRDMALLGEILEGATSRGANQVGEVRFFVDDPDTYKQEARKQAFLKVGAKAKELARIANVNLGKVVSFSESGGAEPPMFYGKAEGLGAGGAGAPPQLEAGTQDISVTITVMYEVR